MFADDAARILTRVFSVATEAFHRLPGSTILVRYVRASHQDDPVRSVIELCLFLFAVYYLLAPRYNPRKLTSNHVALTDREIDELVDDWTPLPLVADPAEVHLVGRRPPLLQRDTPTGPRAKLHDGRAVTNLGSYDHYNFSRDPSLIEDAARAIRKYGVGPCSAPGFYGTFDVHMDLERDIASHFRTEGAIVYSQSFITVSSVIPCFAKRGDIIVADKAVNYGIRKGIQASRSIVRWYDHNDMEGLEHILATLVKEPRALTRRWIITEGLFENVGDIVDLPKLVDLKTKYKFRLLLDETWSYGVLGRTGRGVTELQNVDPTCVDGIVGSLAGGLSAGGGFCTGSSAFVEHQRINSAAVTFSASLCAFLATTASNVIARLQSPEGARSIQALQENTAILRLQLERSEWVRCCSAPGNPVLFLRLKDEHINKYRLSVMDQELLLQDCVDECISKHSVLITRLKAMPSLEGASSEDLVKEWRPQPALKVCGTTALSKKEMEKAGIAIRQAIAGVMKRSV